MGLVGGIEGVKVVHQTDGTLQSKMENTFPGTVFPMGSNTATINEAGKLLQLVQLGFHSVQHLWEYKCSCAPVEAGQAVSPLLPSMLFGTRALVLCAAYGRLAGLGTSRNSPVSVP